MTSSHLLLLAFAIICACAMGAASPLPITVWALAPSSNVTGTPAQISSRDYDAAGWLNVSVPCTVMACLLQNGFYPDVFHGDNINRVPTLQFNETWWCDARGVRAKLQQRAHPAAGTARPSR